MKCEFAEDCIHLKACRRMALIAKKKGFLFGRGCDKETCTAYKNGDYISIETAINYARGGVDSIKSGYGSYDVYCTSDLHDEIREY